MIAARASQAAGRRPIAQASAAMSRPATSVTFWPDTATRWEVPVAFMSSVRSGGRSTRLPRSTPAARDASGSGRASASAPDRRVRVSIRAARKALP